MSEDKLKQEMSQQMGSLSTVMRVFLSSSGKELRRKVKLSVYRYWFLFVPTLIFGYEVLIKTKNEILSTIMKWLG